MNKHFYRTFILLTFIGANTLIILGISSVISYFHSGADRASMLHLGTAQISSYNPKLLVADTINQGRPMHAAAKKAILSDYLGAWYSYNQAFKYNDASLLKDHFTDSAQIKLKRTIDANLLQEVWLKQSTLSHSLEIEFFSEDGRIASLSDNNAQIQKEVYRKDNLLYRFKESVSFRVVMLLEDGKWKIRHLVQVDKKQVVKDPVASGGVNVEGLEQIKGLNYYPKEQAWNMFGEHYNSEQIISDFQLIREMGMNTLRIFVPFEEFGAAHPKAEYTAQLSTTLDIAAMENLRVMVTLFDFYGNYDLEDWTHTQAHAHSIVMALKDHPALLGWDIKNEPDLDFEHRGKDRVLAWLKETIEVVKHIDPNHPVTIGWSTTEAATELVSEVDLVSFHYYLNPEDFESALRTLKSASMNKPLLLQEYGSSSYGGVWNAFTGSEDKQAAFYQKIQPVIEREQLPFMLWTLYDFDVIPTEVVGRFPWRQATQRHYGIIGFDGRPKEVFSFLEKKLKEE